MTTKNHSIQVAIQRPTAPGAPNGAPGEVDSRADDQVGYTPLIDIHEGPDGLILEADLPGATEETVSIQLEDNVLTLHARVVPPAPEGARPLHEEYRSGDFFRSFILSDEVERGQISAELKNGVLRLTLPKSQRARTRRIEISS